MTAVEHDEVTFRWGPWDGHTMRVWPDQLDVVVVAVPPSPYAAHGYGPSRLETSVPRYPIPDRDYGRYTRHAPDYEVFHWAGYVPRTPPETAGGSTDTGAAP